MRRKSKRDERWDGGVRTFVVSSQLIKGNTNLSKTDE